MTLKFFIAADNVSQAHEIASTWLSFPHTHGGLRVLRTEMDRKPIVCKSPPQNKFAFTVEISGTENPSDGKLHALLRNLPPEMTLDGPLIPAPSENDRKKKLALALGMIERQEKGLALSADPSSNWEESDATKRGFAKMKSWGLETPPDESHEWTPERRAELLGATGYHTEPPAQPMTAYRRAELGL